MAAVLTDALKLRNESSRSEVETPTLRGNEWKTICDAAAAARFLWADSAKLYIEKLYQSQ